MKLKNNKINPDFHESRLSNKTIAGEGGAANNN
jgi:hypothetical protein